MRSGRGSISLADVYRSMTQWAGLELEVFLQGKIDGGARARADVERRLEGTRSLDLLTAVMVSGLCLAALIACTDLKAEGTSLYADPGWDRHLYRLMAEQGLFEVRLAPYCWRVLVPALAGWSPASLQVSFFTITIASLWATGVVLHQILRRRGHRPTMALLGMLLFYSLGWGAKFIAADFWIPDGVALLFVALALWAALEKQLVAFAALLLVGALAKESVLLAAPLYLCLNWRHPVEWRFMLRVVLALLPAVVMLGIVRLGVPHENGDATYLASLPGDISRFPELYDGYNYWALFNEIGIDQRWRARNLDALLDYTLRPFGIALPLLALFATHGSRRLAIAFLPSLILTYAQLLVATDTQRLLVLFSPCLVLLAVEGARELEATVGARRDVLLLAGLATFLPVLAGRQTYDISLGVQAAVLLGVTTVVLLSRQPAGNRAGLGP